MNQEPQEILRCEGVSMSMAWWVLLGDRFRYDRCSESKKAAYKQCYGKHGWIANNVLIAATPDFYTWYHDN